MKSQAKKIKSNEVNVINNRTYKSNKIITNIKSHIYVNVCACAHTHTFKPESISFQIYAHLTTKFKQSLSGNNGLMGTTNRVYLSNSKKKP